MDITGLLEAAKQPQALLLALMNYITGMFYPYLPIYSALFLLLLARIRPYFPSNILHAFLFFPALLLSVWSVYVFVTSPIANHVVVGVVGAVLTLFGLRTYVIAADMDLRKLAL